MSRHLQFPTDQLGSSSKGGMTERRRQEKSHASGMTQPKPTTRPAQGHGARRNEISGASAGSYRSTHNVRSHRARVEGVEDENGVSPVSSSDERRPVSPAFYGPSEWSTPMPSTFSPFTSSVAPIPSTFSPFPDRPPSPQMTRRHTDLERSNAVRRPNKNRGLNSERGPTDRRQKQGEGSGPSLQRSHSSIAATPPQMRDPFNPPQRSNTFAPTPPLRRKKAQVFEPQGMRRM